jgi:hypothetical protein
MVFNRYRNHCKVRGQRLRENGVKTVRMRVKGKRIGHVKKA